MAWLILLAAQEPTWCLFLLLICPRNVGVWSPLIAQVYGLWDNPVWSLLGFIMAELCFFEIRHFCSFNLLANLIFLNVLFWLRVCYVLDSYLGWLCYSFIAVGAAVICNVDLHMRIWIMLYWRFMLAASFHSIFWNLNALFLMPVSVFFILSRLVLLVSWWCWYIWSW